MIKANSGIRKEDIINRRMFIILLINSIQITILDLIFLIEINYISYLINSGFTFLFYPLFFFIFNYINKKIIIIIND